MILDLGQALWLGLKYDKDEKHILTMSTWFY